MSDHTDIILLQRDIADLKEQNQRHRAEINRLKDQDNKRMRSAVVVLGGLVLSLVTYIWVTFVGDRGP